MTIISRETREKIEYIDGDIVRTEETVRYEDADKEVYELYINGVIDTRTVYWRTTHFLEEERFEEGYRISKSGCTF